MKRICIIGAGSAGLCAARECIKAFSLGEENSSPLRLEILLFEQRARIGGVWAYSNADPPILSPDPLNSAANDAFSEVHTTGVYEGLRTLAPKEIIFFEELPHYSADIDESFIAWDQLRDYFCEYGKPVEQLVQLNTKVVEVGKEPSGHWRVVTENLVTKTTEIHTNIDAVFVCVGNYNKPRLPAFSSGYKKPWIHSKFYKRAGDYRGLRVALVGSGPSGIDLAMQLGAVASEIFLLHRKPSPTNTSFGSLIPNCVERPAVVDATEDALLLADGSCLDGLDWVIYCTGYDYSYPFFKTTSRQGGAEEDYSEPGAETKELITTPGDGAMVSPLWAHIAHVDYLDSLFFIGINLKYVIPPLVSEWQIRLAIALMTHRMEVGREEALAYERDRLREMEAAGSPLKAYHAFGPEMWDYLDFIVGLARSGQRVGSGHGGQRDAPLEAPYKPYKPVLRAIMDDLWRAFEGGNFCGLRSFRYRALDDETFEKTPL